MSKNITVSIVFLCHDGDGNFLFNKRTKNASDNHGLWDPGSGKVNFGEKSKVALLRELQEEYCSEPISFSLLGVRELANTIEHRIVFDYLVKLDPKQVANCEPEKFEEVKWFKANKLPSNTHPLFSQIWEGYSSKIKILF